MTSTTGFPGGPGADMTHDEWRAMAAAYAIDALDDADCAASEQHLATCAECPALVASYVPVTEAWAVRPNRSRCRPICARARWPGRPRSRARSLDLRHPHPCGRRRPAVQPARRGGWRRLRS